MSTKSSDNSIIITTFVLSNNNNIQQMKRYKVKEVIKMLEADAWVCITTKGDHRQFKHPDEAWKGNDKGSHERGFKSVFTEQHLETGRVEITTLHSNKT